jgi:ABC-2 type transport system ATP-binding protein
MDRASRLLEEVCGAEPVPVSDGSFMVATSILRAGEINQKLVMNGIVVSEFRPVQRSQEETFPELTRREEV